VVLRHREQLTDGQVAALLGCDPAAASRLAGQGMAALGGVEPLDATKQAAVAGEVGRLLGELPAAAGGEVEWLVADTSAAVRRWRRVHRLALAGFLVLGLAAGGSGCC